MFNGKFSAKNVFSKLKLASGDEGNSKGFWVGLMIVGIPLATGSIMIIASLANQIAPPKVSDKPIVPMASYNTPAYVANTKAPDDVFADEADIEYATSDSGSTRIAAADVTKTSYSGSGYVGVDTSDINEPTVSAVTAQTTASQNVTLPQGAIPAPQSSGTGITRTGNDISDRIWADDNITTYNNFTTTDVLADASGQLGHISIPVLSLNVPVYESTTSELDAMRNGVAHFGSTSAWDGNVGLAAHNYTPTGTGDYFRDLYTLGYGDIITYTTSFGTRSYSVSAISRINEEDWSSLGRSDANMLTMITCVNDDPTQRLAVQAIAN